jgi:membrane protease YdiL (CAAX protease family)
MDITADQRPTASGDGHERVFRDADWTPKDVLFGALWFVGLFFGGTLASLPFALGFGALSGQFLSVTFAVSAAVEVGIAIVAANYTVRRYGGGWARLGIWQPGRNAIFWALAAFGGALVVSLAYSGLVAAFDIDWLRTSCAEQIPREVRETRALLALASLAVIAFAPVCEELFFRGFVFPGISNRWGLVAGIIASGVIFSAVHLLPKSFVPIAGVGMVFAYAYYRSRNIFTTMLAHIAFNTLSIAAIAGGSCDSMSSIAFLRGWGL